jgi:16S rRNA (adenine1518-N6/adenine1519-N6)-dimethyltransferase
MRLSRSLGQIFLRDRRYIGKIIRILDINGEDVVEIGPGKGCITVHLAEKANKLVCVELDIRFCSYLEKRFVDNPCVEVVNCDILKFPLAKISEKVVVVGNVPYQISERLVKYLVENRNCIKKAYLMLQKEFVNKLLSKEGTKSYTPLSCYVNYYAKVRKYFDVPARAFSPLPKVNSCFISLEFYPLPPYKVCDTDYLFEIIDSAFCHRRKKIINSFPCLRENPGILLKGGISPEARAEDISLSQYVYMANKLYALRWRKNEGLQSG